MLYLRSINRFILVSLALLGLSVSSANAVVVQSMGAGSAVTSLDASADFENPASLIDNPYVENGLSFSRTGLSFNNNGCGFAGCPAHFATPFGGTNYMYGVGPSSSYFEMSTTGTNIFQGLEFISSTGGSISDPFDVEWTAFLGGSQVGNGALSSVADGTILGFASTSGFDTLQYTVLLGSSRTPAFDAVRAMYTSPSAVPIPAAVWLFGTALIGFVGMSRRRKAA